MELSRLDDPGARRWVRPRNPAWGFGPGSVVCTIQLAMRGCRHLSAPRRDERLCRLLEQAIADCRALLSVATDGSRPGAIVHQRGY